MADILFAHRVIDADQRDAAIRFKRLRDLVFPPPLQNRTPGAAPSEERIAELERAYDRAARLLDENQRGAVADLVLEIRAPWIRRHLLDVPLTPDDELENAALISGLNALAGIGSSKAA